MSESVIALNHIHDCRGDQGDGIEVKQGSWANLIAENDIHDTNYPCITVYGTAGKPVNIIERNLCRRSADHAMQVQGEAIVRNNVLIGAKHSGFASTDHQGRTLNLQVNHNTIVNTGHAFSGGSWNGREGMILANNILYSRDANALHFANGKAGVVITGNVVLGAGPKEGTVSGRGLEDFVNVAWDAAGHDATPAATAPFEHADARYFLETDFTGAKRTKPLSGANTLNRFSGATKVTPLSVRATSMSVRVRPRQARFGRFFLPSRVVGVTLVCQTRRRHEVVAARCGSCILWQKH